MNEQDPLIKRLADANPVPQHFVEGANRSPAANDLLARVTHDGGRRFAVLDRATSHGRLAAAAALLVVVLVAGSLILRSGQSSSASASELLLRAAAVAENRESPLSAGPYLYSKIRSENRTTAQGGQAWSLVVPAVVETWLADDGSGRTRSDFGRYRFFGPRDRSRWEASGSPEPPSGIFDRNFRPGELSYEDVNSLPVQRTELLANLRDHVASQELPSDVGVLMEVGELLARGDAEPVIRAALYRVVAGLPDVELLEPTVDPVGRPGVAVGITYDESGSLVRVVMIFDEETSELLATERILLERASWVDADPGTRLSYIAYEESGFTDSRDDPPTPQG